MPVTTLVSLPDESIEEEHNEEEGPHTPQGKDQVDEDVNDFLENFQAHSPPASELSWQHAGRISR